MHCRTFARLFASLIIIFCCTSVQVKAAESSPSMPLVSVQLTPEFHPEVEFRIAEALRRPPVQWSMLRDHTFAEISEPVAEKEVAAEMIAEWESLLNNPIHVDFQDTVNAHLRAIIKAEFESQVANLKYVTSHDVLSESSPNEIQLDQLPDVHTGEEIVDLIQIDNLPQVHTGEEVMELIAQDEAQFPLDPYGYAEYNHYFEPEIYDWFVFVTDDLTVVYVYENSDEMPSRVDPVLLAEKNAQPEVPESFKVVVREQVRSLFAGEYSLFEMATQFQQHWTSFTQPISIASLKQTELLPIHRVSHLPDLF